jgi:hypothetical protein
MSDSAGPDYVMLPSAENQIEMMYERFAEQHEQAAGEPDYMISEEHRLDEVLGLLNGRTGSVERMHYSGNDPDILEDEEDVDLGAYLENELYTSPPASGEGKVVEAIGSFATEFQDGSLASGYVLTGRELAGDGELPRPMMAEVMLFSDPGMDSWVTVKTQEPSTL